MNPSELIREIITTYTRHGWHLHRVLLRPESRAALDSSTAGVDNSLIHEADFDAIWFARPSHGKREAWELRLISEPPYALFETFEADENEEARDEMRREMENRMREYVQK